MNYIYGNCFVDLQKVHLQFLKENWSKSADLPAPGLPQPKWSLSKGCNGSRRPAEQHHGPPEHRLVHMCHGKPSLTPPTRLHPPFGPACGQPVLDTPLRVYPSRHWSVVTGSSPLVMKAHWQILILNVSHCCNMWAEARSVIWIHVTSKHTGPSVFPFSSRGFRKSALKLGVWVHCSACISPSSPPLSLLPPSLPFFLPSFPPLSLLLFLPSFTGRRGFIFYFTALFFSNSDAKTLLKTAN